ncbi:MAG: hypothetical protein R6X20_00310 [Phycisphaerae bacterium]
MAALALILLLGAGAVRAIEFEPPPPPKHERPTGLTPEGVRLYRLPDPWRTPSGGINQKAIVDHQKKRLEAINDALGLDLQMAQTDHYLIFSNASPAVSRNFLKWCEALYRNLTKHFALSAGERVWDGKCILILFRYRRQFESYARRFDGMTAASRAGAYFGIEAHGEGAPNLAHICIPMDTDDPRRLQELFAHEGTHAFFELYKTQGNLPLWLHEGLAEFMTTVNDKELRPAKWEPAARVGRSGRSIRAMFEVPMGGMLSVTQYRVALTVVEFLLKAGRQKFKRFVDLLKDGVPQEKALKDAYGWSLGEMEARWRIYVTRAAP